VTDWLGIVDSAVKIGLGALIGGAFAIWTIRLNERHDHIKQQVERRCVLLQEAQLEVSRFARSLFGILPHCPLRQSKLHRRAA
jgi:hypothetical protein